MKTRIIIIAIVALGLSGGIGVLSSGCGDKTEEKKEKAVQYHCPMHPTVISDKPGDCPICGMKLVPNEEAAPETTAVKKTMYRSTMNPDEVSDRPGKDSMGMEMVPFEVTEEGMTSGVPGLAPVTISPETQHAIGLELGTVEKRPLSREIRTSARIDADETRLHHMTVKVDGWVNELFASVTGQQVKQGDPLLTIYSPDLVSAQQEYITAVEQRDKMGEGAGPEARQGAEALVRASRRRLELWDVSASQIDRLDHAGQVEKYLTLYALKSGVIIERNIVAGHRVMAGEVLMTIADLSHVWGDADIYQSDLPYVHIGMALEMSFPYWQDKTFRGKVIFISPTLDPETRTLRARLEIPNPELLLRPGMYGDATLDYALGERLAVPAEAVMFSGKMTYAFKDGGGGRLIPIEVHVGTRADDWYEVLDGLEEGDRIVVSANFLVDSESSLKAALDAMTGDTRRGDEHQGHQQ